MTSAEWAVTGSLLSIGGMVAAIALAWGKIMTKVEVNRDDITKIIHDCEKHRMGCLVDMKSNFKVVFEKLDAIQKDVTQLSIKVAKLEK
jgi:hypothetical protein